MEALHRILTGQTAARWELRVAGFVIIEWWLEDHLWFVGTLLGWW